MITREFNLYLHAGHSIPLVINVNQYDRGEQWLFKLFNSDGTQYVPSSGAIVGIKSDNLGIINSGSVDSNGKVVINETQQMTAAVGKAVFELVIDDGAHGTANFVVLVEAKPGDQADLSETDISMIEQAVEAASTIKPYGSPLVASTVAGMTDHDKVYVYVGSETGYTSGNWYYWDGSAWTSGGVYNSVAVQTDTTLTLSGVAADSAKVGQELSDLKSQITQLESIPNEVKLAMDVLFSKMAIIGDTSESYSSEVATIHQWATEISLVSITATFAQGSNIIYDTDPLDALKQYLTVEALYSDGSIQTVTNYTLSGILAEGTSSVTVLYGGESASFNVTVTAKPFAYGVYTPTRAFNGSYINENGEIVEATENSGYIDDFIPVKLPSYWIGYLNADITNSNGSVYNGTVVNWRLSEYDASKNFIKQTHYDASNSLNYPSRIVTFDEDTKYIRLGWYNQKTVGTGQFEIENPSTFTQLTMEVGSINATTGADESNNARCRSVGYIPASGTMSVAGCPWAGSWTQYSQYGGYLFRCYDSDKNIIGSLTDDGQLFHTDITNVALPANTAYVRVMLSMGTPATTFNMNYLNNTFSRLTDINGTKYWFVKEEL